MKRPRAGTAVVATLMTILAAAAAAAADDAASGCENGRYCTCELPHRSGEWTDDLYHMLQRQVLLDLGYVEGDAEACGEPRLAAAPGVDEPLAYYKVFTKENKKKVRCLELGREATRDGRTRFAIYGVEVDEDGGGASANPELPDVKQRCLRVRDQIDDMPLRAPRDRYLTYQLSYVEADRALTLLEALGYSVARYAEKEDDDGFSSFQPTDLTHGKRRPVVVEMLDSAVTSLVTGSTNVEANGTLAGGSPLPGVTSGVPEQRLLIVYDADEKESVEALVNLLSEHVDVPARQILFEALVIEISRDHLRDLGFTLTGMKDGQSISINADAETPFMASFTRPSIKSVLGLTATLEAVVAKGKGTVISRPSVMVLDGRQARIKIADEIPYLQYVTDDNQDTSEGRLFSVDFLTAGIILNLRPRTNHDASEITTQVETIISSASPAGVTAQGLPIAPTVQSREVQTFVRVANDTPFIIGGLLAQDRQQQTTGVPWLSEIPGLGWLFKRQNRSDDRREVMVMITPHVIEPDDRNFGYAIARGSDLFDAFDNDLFRNIYRIRPADVFDLDFLWQGEKLRLLRQSVDACALEIASTDSTTVPDIDPSLLVGFVRSYFEQAEPEPSAKLFEALDASGSEESRNYLARQPAAGRPPNGAVASFLQVLEEGVPGEEILAARMLLHTLENPRFDAFVDKVHNVGLFRAGADGRLRLRPLSEISPGPGDCDPDADPTCTLVLTIPPPPSVGQGGGKPDPEFFPPLVTPTWERLTDAEFITELRKRNAGGQRVILLNDSFEVGADDGGEHLPSRQRLRYALLMKRLLEVNERPDLLTLRGYHVGRELVIPTRDEIGGRRHVIDRRTADFFYHGYDYYKAFETRFQEKTSELASLMKADPACWPPQAADAGAAVILEQHGPGKGAVVLEHDGRFQVSASQGEEQTWVRDLAARPNFLQAGNPTGTVVVGHLRNDGSPRWATVYTADGEAWQPPGEVRSIHLSKQGDKVLAQLRLDGREETWVFDASGRELDRFEIPHGAAHVTRFTARGDAVAVTPGPEEDSSVLEVFEISTGRTQRHELDPAFPIEDTVALDADHVVVVGGGALIMVLFPGAEGFSGQGPVGWSLQAEDPGYLSILGATADGETLLATRGFGRFDLVGRDGRVLWSFDPAESPLRGRLAHLDLGRFHPFLHADGTVELADDSVRGRYLLSWPSAAGGKLGEPLVKWEPAGMAAGR